MRRPLLSLGALALVACSAAAGLMSGNPSNIAAGLADSTSSMVGLTQDLSKCDQLGAAEVTFEEERTIGGAVALNWVQQNGGLLVDVPAGQQRRRSPTRRGWGCRTRPGTSCTVT